MIFFAGSKLNPDLVSRNTQQQTQQDACEFLTWLLYEVHEAVNDAKSATGKCLTSRSRRKVLTS